MKNPIVADVSSVREMRRKKEAYATLFSIAEDFIVVAVRGTFECDNGALLFSEYHWTDLIDASIVWMQVRSRDDNSTFRIRPIRREFSSCDDVKFSVMFGVKD